jgi:hypothetical protein
MPVLRRSTLCAIAMIRVFCGYTLSLVSGKSRRHNFSSDIRAVLR